MVINDMSVAEVIEETLGVTEKRLRSIFHPAALLFTLFHEATVCTHNHRCIVRLLLSKDKIANVIHHTLYPFRSSVGIVCHVIHHLITFHKLWPVPAFLDLRSCVYPFLE